jgi:hypothetical protein
MFAENSVDSYQPASCITQKHRTLRSRQSLTIPRTVEGFNSILIDIDDKSILALKDRQKPKIKFGAYLKMAHFFFTKVIS